MGIKSLKVQNFRIHNNFEIKLAPSATAIIGKNGSGKTSLLEAVYLALQGRSFKGAMAEPLKNGFNWYRVELLAEDEKRVVRFDGLNPLKKNLFEINHKKYQRLPFLEKYPVVLFEPDDLRLIGGSPARRRQYIDGLISQYDPEYKLSLGRYERALKQRNSFLKDFNLRDSDLFAWDVILSRHGAYIIKARQKLIGKLCPLFGQIYKETFNKTDEPSLTYQTSDQNITEQKLLNILNQSIKKDRRLSFTTTGPHLDDLLIQMNSRLANQGASRGEIRTMVLILKYLEANILKELTNRTPIILLDDVFSELDDSRQQQSVRFFSGYQTIITSALDIDNNDVVKVSIES